MTNIDTPIAQSPMKAKRVAVFAGIFAISAASGFLIGGAVRELTSTGFNLADGLLVLVIPVLGIAAVTGRMNKTTTC